MVLVLYKCILVVYKSIYVKLVKISFQKVFFIYYLLLCFLAPQLVHNGGIDFLVFDYLSEITMSLLTAARHKKPVSKPSFIIIKYNFPTNKVLMKVHKKKIQVCNLTCIIYDNLSGHQKQIGL